MAFIIEKLKEHIPLLFMTAIAVVMLSLILPVKIALIVTSLFFLVFAFVFPQQSLLFLIIYISVRPFLLEFNSGIKLIGDIITFVVLIRLILSSGRSWKSLFTFKWFEWVFFIFLAFGAGIGLWQGVLVSSVIFQIRTFLIMYLLYYIISRMVLPESWYRQFAWVIVWTGFITSLHGLVEKLSLRQLLLPDVWKYKVLSATNFVRIYGLPGNPNSFALLLFFALLAVFFLLKIYKTGKVRWFLYINLVLFLGVFILTYSRGTWIIAFIFGAIYIASTRDWKVVKQLVIAGIASIALIYYPVNIGVDYVQSLGFNETPTGPGSIGDRFGETFDQKNLALMTESGRFFYIKKGFEIFRDYPVTGAGFGSFGGSATLSYGSPIYKHYGIRSDIYGGRYFYSDNQYIQVITETGAIGVVLFGLFLIGMLLLFWKERKTVFGKFMIALWFATGFSGFYYNIWELKMYTMFYFILFGMFASYYNYYVKVYKAEQ